MNSFNSDVPMDIFQSKNDPPTGVNIVSHHGYVSWRIVQMVTARERRRVPSAVDVL